MARIQVLDSETIDKIAAGEVVERPSSVVKELVENAIDAGASAITVEAKEGGIAFVRVTDNGCGMEKDQIRTAFLRHATSKIASAEDLHRVSSLGFRGEALSSIAAVSKTEIITKTKGTLTGTRLVLEGAVEKEFQEIGAPDGTTFLVRNLFFNTPVRRKFLKQPATEGGYISELMEHLALSRPDISFKFVLGGQTRFHTSGNGDLKEVIYRIYGREIANCLVPVQFAKDGVTVEGYLGKPVLVRANRNFEIYFINGRFIKSTVVAKSIEEGYKEYLMQHKFPFCVLHISMDTSVVDVNVHPTKMDVRFSNNAQVSALLISAVREALMQREMLLQDTLADEKQQKKEEKQRQKQQGRIPTPEPFEKSRTAAFRVQEDTLYGTAPLEEKDFLHNPVWNRVKSSQDKSAEITGEKPGETISDAERAGGAQRIKGMAPKAKAESDDFFFEEEPPVLTPAQAKEPEKAIEPSAKEETTPEIPQGKPEQLSLFTEKILTVENRSRYRIIGQVFETYWLIQFENKLLIIDQHAAHEKVKYERLIRQYREKTVVSQMLLPPIIVSLNGQEETVLSEYGEVFAGLGFDIESFGGNEYALRSVPTDLYGCSERELFLAVLDELSENISRANPGAIEEKIASMSCKAAVKGNHALSYEEADKLIDELLTLENPYNCPHGRPTMITISQYEMEKKFKRIV